MTHASLPRFSSAQLRQLDNAGTLALRVLAFGRAIIGATMLYSRFALRCALLRWDTLRLHLRLWMLGSLMTHLRLWWTLWTHLRLRWTLRMHLRLRGTLRMHLSLR